VKKSEAEILFAKHLKELKLSYWIEVQVCKERKWRWDFVVQSIKGPLAIEIDGYHKGRHGAGWGADNEKRNTGTMMGYKVLVFSTNAVLNGSAKEFLAKNLGGQPDGR